MRPPRRPRGPLATGPLDAALKAAESAGEEAEAATRELLEEETEAGVKRSAKDITDEAKRAGRRRRTEMLDLGLELNATWFRDLAATASGATEVVFNRDRLAELQSRAAGLDPARARRAAELVQDTRRRLDLNVSEELALEALALSPRCRFRLSCACSRAFSSARSWASRVIWAAWRDMITLKLSARPSSSRRTIEKRATLVSRTPITSATSSAGPGRRRRPASPGRRRTRRR